MVIGLANYKIVHYYSGLFVDLVSPVVHIVFL